MVERLTGSGTSPIQARPAYAAMTAGPIVLATPPTPPPAAPVDVPSKTAEAPPPQKPATPPKTARKVPTPPRPTVMVKTEVRPTTVARPVVTAMTAPPPASMAPPPPETPVRAIEPVPEPLPKSQVFEISQVDVRPEVASRTEPSYPASARERGVEDVVVVRVLVSANGRAADTQLLRRSRHDAAFDSAALTAVRQWTFTPARKRDRVVSCWMNVGVPFRMPRAEGSQ
jgi:protein TonB